MNQSIRNIAIIAHVDHGKTTLVDKLLKEGGVFRANQQVEERAMDSMDLEKEKGITIKAKNTSVHWEDKIINIVDTPGHADFGGEVERALRMVDGVLLVVDAYDGPQAQTRFVLRKALQHGLKVIIVINKIDRDNAEPAKMYEKVLELLMELNATEEQFDAPVVYGSGRDGYMMKHLADKRENMTPLFETILEHIPPPFARPDEPFHMLVSNIDWSDYVGRIAIGKNSRRPGEHGRHGLHHPPRRRQKDPFEDYKDLRVHRTRDPGVRRRRRRRQHRRSFRFRGHRHR
jgi:GTP-binding protein